PDSLKRSTGGIPRLYQKYIGHDNNRDFYIVNQPETENMTRILFHEWFPEIVYNHHQTGPAGAVLFAPPFRDPFNYFFDPLVPMGIDALGAAMHGRFEAEGKPGATMRRGANYSTWWNGGLRTSTYFHNMIELRRDSITPARGPRGGAVPTKYFAILRDPDERDPRGYVLPADQPDFLTATKFVNTLIKNGITVMRASQPFDVKGKRYPSGSFVIKTAQAFRPHVLDMFEPQDHPNDFQYPGGPPIPPYDNAGYTLAFQMGVQFDRIL